MRLETRSRLCFAMTGADGELLSSMKLRWKKVWTMARF